MSGSLYPPTGEGDIASWGRNFHEMVILSGIEAQRQKVCPTCAIYNTCLLDTADRQTVKAFEEQFQQRMLSMWESEKARVLQDELGVTDDVDSARFAGQASVLGQSSLGRSSLGASTRKVSRPPPAGVLVLIASSPWLDRCRASRQKAAMADWSCTPRWSGTSESWE